jgi:hypothetical protein
MLRWRTLGRGLVIVLAGDLVLCLAFLVYGRVRLRWAEASFLKTYGTLELASFERPTPPRMQNAAAWYSAGAGALVLDDSAHEDLDVTVLGNRPLTDWKRSDREKLRALLADNRCALDLLHRAPSAPDANWGIRYRMGVSAALPALQTLRLAEHVLAIEARLAAERGDLSSSTAAFRSLSRLTFSLEGEASLLMLLHGLSCEDLLVGALAEWLARPVPAGEEAALLVTLREALPNNDLTALARRVLASDGLSLASALGRTPEGFDWWPGARPGRWRIQRWMMRLLSEPLCADVLEHTIAKASTLEGPASIAPDSAVHADDRLRPAIDRALAARHLIRAAFTLRSIGLARGAYPNALPAELQLRDPLTGRPLTYTLNPDGSAALALQLDVAAAARMPLSLRAIALPPPTRPAMRR